jgi:ABC-type phosphate transport system substrate-binding protein
MDRIRKWWIGAAVAGALVVVAGLGAVGSVMAQTPSTTPPASQAQSDSTPAAGSTATTPQSNEDPTHEANETAEQEQAEDSGQAHRGGRNCPHSSATPPATPSSGN